MARNAQRRKTAEAAMPLRDFRFETSPVPGPTFKGRQYGTWNGFAEVLVPTSEGSKLAAALCADGHATLNESGFILYDCTGSDSAVLKLVYREDLDGWFYNLSGYGVVGA